MSADVTVVRARLYEVALPLRAPFTISGGTMRVRRSLIVELEDQDGVCGWGESAPFEQPFYSAETVASARTCLAELLLPRMVAHPAGDSLSVADLLGRGIRGNRMARAGADTAWWDLRAALEGKSLAELVSQRLARLGVPERWLERRDRIDCGIALGIPEGGDLDQLRRDVESALAEGYRRVKIKVKPGWDAEPARVALEVLREASRGVPLTVDANGAYRLSQHLPMLELLDRLALLYIEQPLDGDALWDLVQLSRRLETPICLDESLTCDDVARQVVEMSGPTVWNIKVQRVGGLEEACRIYARAVAAGVQLWAGTMPESGLGAQATLALACHAGFVYPSDLEPSERWYAQGADLVELKMASDGTMAVPKERPIPDLQHATLVYEAVRKL
ncbi:MAG: o-succinylbenzoate synthase [Gemmatimonadales bacterium]|nr:o-succinylbenzoate synthase [Gemmatimonadales bacterium]NIN13319.1 o-succinylbenzoate synthase [Gemmatimonadales bacterium]NIN51322.1 o-succinylbenzoate synthase [Gemmatimonadales bacterium]NIP08786.1 o-succinylbenzoate synthase [Gemmatimonadales bacterium]NIQ99780.1 o-succinylbenzoate synthase [Gemmatimonadales bacterium]